MYYFEYGSDPGRRYLFFLVGLRSMLILSDRLKDVVQDLFEIQSITFSYLGPETQQELVRKMWVALSIEAFPLRISSPPYIC